MDYLSMIVLAVHIICAAVLIGGALAWQMASARMKVDDAIASWKPVVITAIAGLLVTGVYNYLHRPVKSPTFQMLFGIKMLLALHVFVVTIIATRPNNERRSRQLMGVVISGILILIISAAFRWVY
jgi:hypothetical protein